VVEGAIPIVEGEAILTGATREVSDPLLGIVRFPDGVGAMHVLEQPDPFTHRSQPVVHGPPHSLPAVDVPVCEIAADRSSLHGTPSEGVSRIQGAEDVSKTEQMVAAGRSGEVGRSKDVARWMHAPVTFERLPPRFLFSRRSSSRTRGFGS